MTDRELGYQHGALGFEEKYPNNVNYMAGFEAGTDQLMREIEAERPFLYPEGPGSVNADYIADAAA
jgi:hypothetical protein